MNALLKNNADGFVGGDLPQAEPMYKDKYAKYRAKNLQRLRERDARMAREKRAAKAISEGRIPGRVGREAVLTDAQRLSNRRANSRAYRQRHPEKAEAMDKAYYQSHKDDTLARVRARRAIKKLVGGRHTAADIRRIMILQKGKCTWCLCDLGDEKPHVDHKVPMILGGSNGPENLQLLHKVCNLAKGPKHPVEYGLNHGLLAW